MQNALLVGLSRQMSLGNQIDIIANNIANIDTTGFKADTAAFSEYLGSGASDGDFAGKDRRISFVQDHGTWIDFSPGAMQRTGDPLDAAIDGKGYFVVQTPRGQRYTRNGAFGPTPRVSSSPPPATSCSAPTGRSISSPPITTSSSARPASSARATAAER
jgi:flagellar hook-basal body protein